MPIYEYECPKCGHFEVIQKTSAKALNAKPGCTDPSCPAKAVRLMSSSAFHLKGSGWYKTDYAGKSKTADTSKSVDASAATKSDLAAQPSGGCGTGCACHGGKK